MKTSPLYPFPNPHLKSKPYETFKINFRIKTKLKKGKSTILPVDKGTRLVIITKTTLYRIYNAYTHDNTTNQPWQPLILTRSLREALEQLPSILKVKVHKDTLPTVEHHELNNIFIFMSDPITLLPFF